MKPVLKCLTKSNDNICKIQSIAELSERQEGLLTSSPTLVNVLGLTKTKMVTANI